jgi:hypothetical protein
MLLIIWYASFERDAHIRDVEEYIGLAIKVSELNIEAFDLWIFVIYNITLKVPVKRHKRQEKGSDETINIYYIFVQTQSQ